MSRNFFQIHSYNFGNSSDGRNYRPMWIIPYIDKLFEFLVYSRTKRSLSHIIIDKQHGFRPGKLEITSCVIFTVN